MAKGASEKTPCHKVTKAKDQRALIPFPVAIDSETTSQAETYKAPQSCKRVVSTQDQRMTRQCGLDILMDMSHKLTNLFSNIISAAKDTGHDPKMEPE